MQYVHGQTGFRQFDARKRDELRVAYNKAAAAQHESFVFEGNEWHTQYAKYMLEYLDTRFEPCSKKIT